MLIAMKCKDNWYRVEHDNGTVEVFEGIEELREYYKIIGTIESKNFHNGNLVITKL